MVLLYLNDSAEEITVPCSYTAVMKTLFAASAKIAWKSPLCSWQVTLLDDRKQL